MTKSNYLGPTKHIPGHNILKLDSEQNLHVDVVEDCRVLHVNVYIKFKKSLSDRKVAMLAEAEHLCPQKLLGHMKLNAFIKT